MPSIMLSDAAVAVLRFRLKRYRVPPSEQRRPAFEELVAAGIMEPDGEDYRFTDTGKAEGPGILREQEERINREQYEPLNPDLALSEAAMGLLKRRLAGERVEITEQTRHLYEELAAARLMEPLHTFANGPNGHYRLTEAACALRET